MRLMNQPRNLTNQFMFTAAAAIAAVAVCCGQARAVNDLLAGWEFETVTPVNNVTTGPIANFDTGSTVFGTLHGVHASAATDWSTPAGNGGGVSYSVNTWAVNDYYQFQFDTLGVSGIGIQFDQVGSSTGPRDFKVQYSTDGTSFTDFGNYSIQVNNGPAWNNVAAVAPAGLDTYSFDLSSITALNNRDSTLGDYAYIRLTDASTVSTGGGTVAAGGTNRLDKVKIYNNFDPTQAPVPQPFAPPVAPLSGDLVMGVGSERVKVTLDLVRPVSGVGQEPAPFSPWQSVPFIQRVKFDNAGGTAHNVQGNLLAIDAGANITSNTGKIYNLATQGSLPYAGNQLLATVAATRISGLSVAPDNSKIALASADTGQVIVYDYVAGATVGTGAGASLTGLRQTTTTPLTPIVGTTTQPQGTAWRNNSTVLALSAIGKLFEVDATTMAATDVMTLSPLLPSLAASNTALAYNPSVSPYVYAMLSGFSGNSTSGLSETMLYILDPATGYSIVNDINLSATSTGNNIPIPAGAVDSGRDLALDATGNLFISANGSRVSYVPSAVLNSVSPADNSAVNWYTSTTFSNFNGIDIGFTSATLPGDYNLDGSVNAADYVTWRKDPASHGGAGGYDIWRQHFNNPPGSGSGLDSASSVPEPASVVLLLIGLAAFAGRRRTA